MNNRFCLLPLLALALAAHAQDATPIAQDDATSQSYGASWADGSNGGSGFGAWKQQTAIGAAQSFAGFFIGTSAPAAVSKDGKAFGLFANGVDFEVATAFRGFNAPLAAGQSFTVTWQTGPYAKKFDTDSTSAGSVGVTLRTGNEASSPDDYNKNSRFEFGVYAGMPNYQIYDGMDNHDTGIASSDGGVKLKFTLVTADTYNLDVTTLADGKTQTISGRKLAGAAGGTLDSLCLFDRNWEKNDAFFNNLAVLPAASSPSPASSPAAK